MKSSKNKQQKTTKRRTVLAPRKNIKLTPVELEQKMWDKYYDAMSELDKVIIKSFMPGANSFLIKVTNEVNDKLAEELRSMKHTFVEKVKRVEKAYSGRANSNKRNDEISLTTINYLSEVIKKYNTATKEIKEAI
jgi:hypothetical protein